MSIDMKTNLALALFFVATISNGQSATEAAPSNYVVIGAFAIEQNAIQFSDKAKSHNHDAEFAVNPNRNLYYVYVMQTDDRTAAFSEAKRLQVQSSYWDTWVYNGVLGKEIANSSMSVTSRGTDLNPSTKKSMDTVKPMDSKESKVMTSQPQGTSLETMASSNGLAERQADVAAENQAAPVEEKKIVEIEEGSKAFRFNLISALKGKNVDGEITMTDPSNARKLGTYPANEIVGIKPPNTKGKVNFVCEVFGYRKVEKTVDYNNPESSEFVKPGENNESVIDFDLVRLRKGDKSIMYNVYFYKDAAIMRPESKTDVANLTEMMKENPKYRIKIHGHTNGGGAGKIISLGDPKNFFSLTGSSDGYGSSKKLSQVRAETIKEYLIAEGITEDRMEVKAWGGKRNLYDKHHAQAHANVRVEIEILDE